MNGSQKPPRQSPLQQEAELVHAAPISRHEVGGVPQTPPVQVALQQLALLVQAAPWPAQGVLQTCAVGSQTPTQQSPSVVQAAVSPWQVSVPKLQRGGFVDLSQTSVQQPLPGPELQVSPVGRQSRLA